MIQYGKIYRLEWKTLKNEFTVRVNIYDTTIVIGDSDTPEVFDLIPSANPLILRTIDNDKDKFGGLKPKEAIISFIAGDIDINTFFDSGDNDFYVEIYLPDTDVTIFKGFLILNDLYQQWLPDPVEVVLTATDMLGALKDIPLSNKGGSEALSGKILISLYYAHCLRSTGMELDFKAMFNIRELETHNYHLWWKNYIDVLTFEGSEIGELEDCNTVLTKLLTEQAVLTQYKGEWFIRRLDEFDNSTNDHVAQFTFEGEYVSISDGFTYLQNVGILSNARWCNANQLISAERPHKSVELTFNYEYPKEIPCNKDFERGDLTDGSDPLHKTYELDCWTLQEGNPFAPTTVDGTTATIHRIFNNIDYEIERYIKLTPRTSFESSSVNDATYIISSAIEVHQKDKIEASIDFRLESDISTGGGLYRLFRVILSGDDGSLWILGNESTFDPTTPLQWKNTSGWTAFTGTGVTDIDFDLDDTEWRSVSYSDVPAIPVDGRIYLMINQLNQFNSSNDNINIWYSNLNFTYIPYINGSYQKYSGQKQKITTTSTGYNTKREKEVFISDSPKKILKGGIFRFDDGVSRFVLSEKFFRYNVFPGLLPGEEYFFPYGEIECQSSWNQYLGASRIISGDIYGLDDTNPHDVIHRYRFTNTDPNINTRDYALLSFEQNWKTEQWNGYFIEVYNRLRGHTYTDTHEFKYING